MVAEVGQVFYIKRKVSFDNLHELRPSETADPSIVTPIGYVNRRYAFSLAKLGRQKVRIVVASAANFATAFIEVTANVTRAANGCE